MDIGLYEMPKPIELLQSDTQVIADPMLDKRTRRIFTTQYKLRIIAEADQCRHIAHRYIDLMSEPLGVCFLEGGAR
jgi:hypothetical protein